MTKVGGPKIEIRAVPVVAIEDIEEVCANRHGIPVIRAKSSVFQETRVFRRLCPIAPIREDSRAVAKLAELRIREDGRIYEETAWVRPGSGDRRVPRRIPMLEVILEAGSRRHIGVQGAPSGIGVTCAYRPYLATIAIPHVGCHLPSTHQDIHRPS